LSRRIFQFRRSTMTARLISWIASFLYVNTKHCRIISCKSHKCNTLVCLNWSRKFRLGLLLIQIELHQNRIHIIDHIQTCNSSHSSPSLASQHLWQLPILTLNPQSKSIGMFSLQSPIRYTQLHENPVTNNQQAGHSRRPSLGILRRNGGNWDRFLVHPLLHLHRHRCSRQCYSFRGIGFQAAGSRPNRWFQLPRRVAEWSSAVLC